MTSSNHHHQHQTILLHRCKQILPQYPIHPKHLFKGLLANFAAYSRGCMTMILNGSLVHWKYDCRSRRALDGMSLTASTSKLVDPNVFQKDNS
ncbi:hypothetical protein Hanom_Chr02g00104461 [Helianthus anomalus]